MTTISMHDATVKPCVRALTQLAAILEKGQAYAEAKKIEPSVLVGARLFPDMLPLSVQVQIAADSAKGGASRLAQATPPAFEDNEKTFPELIERCRKTIAVLESLDAKAFVGSEDRTVTWKTRSGDRSMQGLPYLMHWVLPNVFFHVTTAYDILRHNGVEVGKRDFLGPA